MYICMCFVFVSPVFLAVLVQQTVATWVVMEIAWRHHDDGQWRQGRPVETTDEILARSIDPLIETELRSFIGIRRPL